MFSSSSQAPQGLLRRRLDGPLTYHLVNALPAPKYDALTALKEAQRSVARAVDVALERTPGAC